MSTTIDHDEIRARLAALTPNLQARSGWQVGAPPIYPERYTADHLILLYKERWNSPWFPDDLLADLAADVITASTRALDAAMAATATPYPTVPPPLPPAMYHPADPNAALVMVELPSVYAGEPTPWYCQPDFVVDIARRVDPDECEVTTINRSAVVMLSPRAAAERLGFKVIPAPDDGRTP